MDSMPIFVEAEGDFSANQRGAIGFFRVVAFSDKHQVVEECDFRDVSIEVRGLVVLHRIFLVIEAIGQSLEKFHRASRAGQSSSPTGPVRCLDIFHGVNAIGVQAREEGLEALDDVFIQVAAVIDDNVETSVVIGQADESLGIALIALANIDAALSKASGVFDVDSNDTGLAKKRLPHAQGFRASGRVVVTTHPDLQQREARAPQRPEVALIMLCIPVATPFVRAEDQREPVEVISVPPTGEGPGQANKIPVGGWRQSFACPGFEIRDCFFGSLGFGSIGLNG